MYTRYPVDEITEDEDGVEFPIGHQNLSNSIPTEVRWNFRQDPYGTIPSRRPKPSPRECDEHQGEHQPDGLIVGLALVRPRRDFLPILLHDQPHTIERTPGDEVPRRAVPQTAQHHGEHQVDVGIHPTLCAAAVAHQHES